jgi:hypothetical protein
LTISQTPASSSSEFARQGAHLALYIVLAALIIFAGLIAAIHAQPLPWSDPLDQAQRNTQRWIEQQQQQNFECGTRLPARGYGAGAAKGVCGRD